MLSSHERLRKRQGQHGTPRDEYLQQLVNEYGRTQQNARKEEIVAHLANFAYDPINYAIFRQLKVMDLFVDVLQNYASPGDSARINTTASGSKSSAYLAHTLVEFAMGGICNCIPDPSLQVQFIDHGGVATVMQIAERVTIDIYTQSPDPSDKMMTSAFNTALSALTTCYFLLDSPAFTEITVASFVRHVSALRVHTNPRIANIATAFTTRHVELLRDAIQQTHATNSEQ